MINTIKPIEDCDRVFEKVDDAKHSPDEVTVENQVSKRADKEQEQPDRQTTQGGSAAINPEAIRDESPDTSIYSHESGELFAEDVDQPTFACKVGCVIDESRTQ